MRSQNISNICIQNESNTELIVSKQTFSKVIEETSQDVNSRSDTSAFEYATYAAMLAAITAYTLAEKKRKEEEARRREEAKSARLEKEAKKRAALQRYGTQTARQSMRRIRNLRSSTAKKWMRRRKARRSRMRP